MKRLLITGSAGFIGRHAVKAAEARGWHITGVDFRTMDTTCRAIYTDCTILSGVYECTHVLHLAAYSSNAGFVDNLTHNYCNNINGLRQILELVRRNNPQARLLYASSSAVYGNYCHDAALCCTEEFYDQHTASHYAKSKLINEMMAESYRAIRINALGLRIFNAYGSGDELKPVGRQAPMTWMQAAKREGKPAVIYSDGTQAKDFIHVSDVVEIIMRLLESDAQGIVNVGTGVATSFDALAGLIGCEREYRPIPDPASYQFYTRADTSRLLSIIGPYKFKTVEEGLKL